MKKPALDYILVPAGLAVMCGYHLWLLLRILRRPTKTVVGINSLNRQIWVRTMMEVSHNRGNLPQDPAKNGVLAVQTLRNGIMASTLMASTAIMLSSLMAVLMTSGNSHAPGVRMPSLVLGHAGIADLSVKFFFILLCFLVAFLLHVQSVRYYSHASLLINVPMRSSWQRRRSPEYVASVLNRGSHCWSLGLRAFYFSFPLFFWIFGSVPMVSCCLLLVGMLYFLDVYSNWGDGEDGDEEEGKVADEPASPAGEICS